MYRLLRAQSIDILFQEKPPTIFQTIEIYISIFFCVIYKDQNVHSTSMNHSTLQLSFGILLVMPQYSDLRPNFNCQYQLFNNSMSLSDSLWNISIDEPSFDFFNHYLDSDLQPFHHTFQENTGPKKIIEESLEYSLELAHPLADTQSEQKQSPIITIPIQDSKRTTTQCEPSEEGSGMRKKFKTSPYHNFQKHLNTAIRHIVTFPSLQPESPKVLMIAQRLWTIFLGGENSTKKILSFIFNEYNQYCIKPNELRDFGFEEAYSCYGKEQLSEAKTFLTKLAIDQLNEENISDYLETRRIKNHQKFKKYLSVFRNELKDGFLKKRINNRNRKEKMKKQLTNMSG